MSKPFFSIIIPTLNEARYLPKLLQDLVDQSYKGFEVIVVDGGSRDKTVQLAKEYSKSLPSLTILNSTRAHVCTQRNLGASHAKADILIFSDADIRLPLYFIQGIKYRWESEQADILSPFIMSDSKISQYKTIAAAINLYIDLQMNFKPKFLLESCVVISKKCFRAVGGFNDNVDYSEGNVFLSSAISKGFVAKVIKDPEYAFSFRRLRKYGTTKTIGGVFTLQISDLLGLEQKQLNLKKLYPMLGGGAYTTKYKVEKNRISKFIRKIGKLLKDF